MGSLRGPHTDEVCVKQSVRGRGKAGSMLHARADDRALVPWRPPRALRNAGASIAILDGSALRRNVEHDWGLVRRRCRHDSHGSGHGLARAKRQSTRLLRSDGERRMVSSRGC